MAGVPPTIGFSSFLKSEKAMELEELNELAVSMAMLEDFEPWEEFVGLIRKAREAAERLLRVGPTLEQAEYARAMGMLAVLDQVETLPELVREIAAARVAAVERQQEPDKERGARVR